MADRVANRCVLGKEFHITGELVVQENAVIEGRVDGVVRAAGAIELAPTGQVNGVIVGGVVRVAGKTEGDIVGEQEVELLPGAKMRGRVYANRFCVNEGAGFRGEIWVDEEAMAAADEQVLAKLGKQTPSTHGSNGHGSNGAHGGTGRRHAEAPELTADEVAVLTDGDNNGNGRSLRPRFGGNGSR